VNSGRDEDDGLVASEASDFLVAEREALGQFESLLAFVRADHQHVYGPAFVAFGQLILCEEQFFI